MWHLSKHHPKKTLNNLNLNNTSSDRSLHVMNMWTYYDRLLPYHNSCLPGCWYQKLNRRRDIALPRSWFITTTRSSISPSGKKIRKKQRYQQNTEFFHPKMCASCDLFHIHTQHNVNLLLFDSLGTSKPFCARNSAMLASLAHSRPPFPKDFSSRWEEMVGPLRSSGILIRQKHLHPGKANCNYQQ